MEQTIIGISGWAGSGKDTLANMMDGYNKLSFGQAVKDALYALNPTIHIYGVNTTIQKDVARDGWDVVKRHSEVRGLLQRMGTEVGRNIFGDNVWVDIVFSKMQDNEKYVIADVRFKNEADAIRAGGGQVWRIHRDGVKAPNDHVSEHELDDYKFDRIIVNNGTRDDLKKYII
jgi:hypothetical protein